MKRFRVEFPAWFKPLWPVVLILACGVGLLTYQIVALAPRFSPTEQALRVNGERLVELLLQPGPLPQRLLQWSAAHLPGDSLLWARLPSVVLAVVSLAIAAYVLYRWYGRRSMVYGLILMATSAWFLHVGRFAGPEIAYSFAVLALLAVHLHLRDNEESSWAWYIWLAVNAVLFTIPGMLWFVLLSLVWQWRAIIRALTSQSVWQWCLSALIPLTTVGWVVYVAVRDHGAIWKLLGLPDKLAALTTLPHDLLQTALFFVYRGPDRPELWLGQLPIFDLFILAMFLLGAYFYAQHWRAERTQLLASYLLLGILLISLGIVGISVVVPIFYIVAVAGIAYALHFWLRRFPRNPLARYAGVSAMSLVVLLSCYFNLSAYFVAWPHNPTVIKVYRSTH